MGFSIFSVVQSPASAQWLEFFDASPAHSGMDQIILEKRRKLYEEAKAAHPKRWSGEIRDWTLDTEVWLNPERVKTTNLEEKLTS